MTVTKTAPYRTEDYLETDEQIAAYLNVTLEDCDAKELAHALGVIARARGMTQLAKDAGLTRASLYKALSEDGNPSMDTMIRVVRALGLSLHVDTVPPQVSAAE